MGADESKPMDAEYGTGAVGRRASRKASKKQRKSTYSGFGEEGGVTPEFMAAMQEALESNGDDLQLVPNIASMSGKALMKLEAHVEKRTLKLKDTITRLSQNDNQGFVAAYRGISAGRGSASEASLIPENNELNRYNNIVAFDHSRVKVKKTEFNGKNDYINANWIDGQANKKVYIASQGPVPQSFPSFWQMIWEGDIRFVVMVTNEVEGGKLKCHRYWPLQEEGAVTFGSMSLSMSFMEVHATYVSRHFSLTNIKTKETRDIAQFAYTAWPDHGVPSTTKELLHFRKIIRSAVGEQKSPVLVHCSAGVGRTGTFIGMDRFVESVLMLKDVPILNIVEDMRKSRNFMVQSQIQFMYLYLISLDALERMMKAVRRQRFFGGMTETEIHDLKLKELTNELSKQEQTVGTLKKKKKRNVVDARAAVGGAKDDLHTAEEVGLIDRLQAAAENTAQWANRQNVPMTAEQHGYDNAHEAGLEDRLEALVVSKDNWLQGYNDAKDLWKLQQDENDNYYNVEHEMSPLESRLQSLSMAESAWEFRGDGMRSSREADARENLASLTQRLEALHSTIISSDARWKTRGDGMREEHTHEPEKVHTADNLGDVMNRLVSLQQDTEKWNTRNDHTSTAKYSADMFEADRQQERARQEDTRKTRVNKEEDMLTKMRKKREAEDKAEAEEEAKRAAEQAEEDRKAKIKAAMKQAAEVPTAFVSPTHVRMQQEAERKKAANDKTADAARKAEGEAAKKAAVEQRKDTEKKKANKAHLKFLSKHK